MALFIGDAHDLHPKTLTSLKRLFELATDGKGKIAIVLIGHPKLKNDRRRPSMEEVGDRITVFEFGGLRDRQRDYSDGVMRESDTLNPQRSTELVEEMRAAGLPL